MQMKNRNFGYKDSNNSVFLAAFAMIFVSLRQNPQY